ncbi:hypothetical protein SBA3_4500008 [Candidatus Sulfopaludibacter sp. SbA3]|nr:hypothetical protein SBA3_4500008 [Candidatus Sulfopaludibacter sp. SbA3]
MAVQRAPAVLVEGESRSPGGGRTIVLGGYRGGRNPDAFSAPSSSYGVSYASRVDCLENANCVYAARR